MSSNNCAPQHPTDHYITTGNSTTIWTSSYFGIWGVHSAAAAEDSDVLGCYVAVTGK